MNNKKQSKDGYILILTLLIISIAVVVGTYLFNRSSMYIPFARITVEREKAKQLAQTGLQLAIAQIAFVPTQDKDAKAGQQQKNKNQQTDLLFITQESIAHFIPKINSWQTFELDENKDGVDGTLQLCLMSEEGKININHVYDFENKKFIGEGLKQEDWKVILQDLLSRIEKQTKSKGLFAAFEQIVKKRNTYFDDVTELLYTDAKNASKNVFAQAFANNIFFTPSSKVSDKQEQRSLYLTDIFTVFTSSNTLQPWMLSDSLAQIVGLSPISLVAIDARTAHIEKIKKEIKKEFNWNVDWKKFLQPLYQKDSGVIVKNIMPLFVKNFEPTVFSVRCHATVGRITQQLYAIIERLERADNGQIVYDVKIKRLYYL